eukprot:190656_1
MEIHQNTYIVLALAGIPFMFLFLSMNLHLYQHFKCQSCCIPTTPKTLRGRCFCTSSDGEKFDFFPMAFLVYLLLWMFVCAILLIRMFLTKDNHSWLDSLSQFDMPSINAIISIQINPYLNLPHTSTTSRIIFVMDCIMLYLIMIMSLIESLFNFYRFYTTLLTSKYLKLTTLSDVIKRYTIYILIFATLYGVTVHLYFWILPLVILLHLGFGIYCNWKFASILIMSYTNFIGLSGSASSRRVSVSKLTHTDEEVLRSVYFMRKVSLICTVLQSLYLFLFLVFYGINTELIIIYLPVLWSISSFIFALNFVRNRLCVQRMIKRMCCCNRHNKQDTVRSQSQIVPQDTPLAVYTPNAVKDGGDPFPDTIKAQMEKHPVRKSETEAHETKNTQDKAEKLIPQDIMVELKPITISVLDLKRDTNHASQYTPPGKDTPETPTTPNEILPLTFQLQQASKSLTRTSYKPQFKDVMSLTAKDSMYEASILTETDVDGRKQDEFNRNITNGSHCESAVYPSPKMKPSTRFPRVASIDIGVLHEDEAMEIKKEEAARPKLDIEQVMLQLSLMRKFGFDVKQFETKLKKALAS